jgi:DNA-binding transcriptional ArsR family regulator
VTEIADMLGIPAVNVSHHLNVLRNSRLIRGKKQGRFVWYSLYPGVLEEVVEAGTPKEALNLGCCRLELPCEESGRRG